MSLHYLIGSAMEPICEPAIIPHICNDIGVWGSGFVLAVSAVNKLPERSYLDWKRAMVNNLPLGICQTVPITDTMWVVNMIAQRGIQTIDGIPPLRLEALAECLKKVNDLAKLHGATVHAPRIGAVRSGGKWSDIEKVIKENLTVDTYIYTLEIEKDMWDSDYENA
jgi:hypothetical protein